MNSKRVILSFAERLALRMVAAAVANANAGTESRILSRTLSVLNLLAEGKVGEASDVLTEYAAEAK